MREAVAFIGRRPLHEPVDRERHGEDDEHEDDAERRGGPNLAGPEQTPQIR